jgi:hypothetical protein
MLRSRNIFRDAKLEVQSGDWISWLGLLDGLPPSLRANSGTLAQFNPHSFLTHLFQYINELHATKLFCRDKFKNSSHFMKTQNFIPLLATPRYLSLFCGKLIHSTPFHPVSDKYFLILLSPLQLRLLSGRRPLDFPTKPCMNFCSPPLCTTRPPHLISLIW